MSKMKHLFRKLHIGGGNGGGLGEHHHHPHHSLSADPTTIPQQQSGMSPPSSGASSSESRTTAADAESPVTATSALTIAEDFSFFEEEYQVQLALAISASDPDGLQDPDLVQIKAAKRMSLGLSAVPSAVDAGRMKFLSLRYWSTNVVNYDEKLSDGFYDVYGVQETSDPRRKIPSLVELQQASVSENIDYEVIIINRNIDPALKQLEQRALSILSESKTAELGPIESGLVQKMANLVVCNMGGPVVDADEMLRRWTFRSYELRTSLGTIVLPLGLLDVGLSRHRALLFKVLADQIGLPCRLVRGSYYTGTDEGAVNLIKVNFDSEFIIDLMGAPGTLIPVEIPNVQLHDSETSLLCFNTTEQAVKDLCLALDNVTCEIEQKNDILGSYTTSMQAVDLLPMDMSRASPSQEDVDFSIGNMGQARCPVRDRKCLPLSGGRSCKLGSMDASLSDQKANGFSLSMRNAVEAEFPNNLGTLLREDVAVISPSLNKSEDPSDDLTKNIDSDQRSVDEEGMPYLNCQCHLVPIVGVQSSHQIDSIRCVLEGEATHHEAEMIRNSIQIGTDCLMVKEALVQFSPSFTESSTANINCLPSDTTVVASVSDMVILPDALHRVKSNQDGAGTTRDLFIVDHTISSPILEEVSEWEIPWDDLQIGERIGLGSCGEVYRADWNGTEVAVKKFLGQDLSVDALEQFRCEVKIMLRLRHPNVVLFMGAITRPPNLAILTEFLPRGSLYKLLHRPNHLIDEKRRLRMALDVARGMNYLHSSHPTIVHRDLKSPNLLVDKNWVVKVCDFGLSRLKHHTFLSSKSTAGTPEWMAPEVLRNEPSNEKCDVYSFGVILWELATLRTPWSGLNPMQVVGAVGFQHRRLEIPQDVDPTLAQIINDCWESDSSLRPSFGQLLSPLKKLQRLVVPYD